MYWAAIVPPMNTTISTSHENRLARKTSRMICSAIPVASSAAEAPTQARTAQARWA